MESGVISKAKGIVCVTGGTGYIASWLIMRLLQHGYSVNATTRSNSECRKDISFLTSLPGAPERLRIFNADLQKPETFSPAIEGSIGVFHVAHPMEFEAEEAEVIDKAVKGTLGVLKACVDAKTVRRVILTSSAYSVAFNNKGLDEILDENCWSDVVFVRYLKPDGASYIISKTLSEKAALEFAEEHGLDLLTLIPTLVTGPFLCPGCPATVYTSLSMIFGDQNHFKFLNNATLVHVDDLASAYIFLFELPDAKGRYICSSITLTLEKLAEFLSKKYPDYPVPSAHLLKDVGGFKISGLSSKKLLDAGFKFKHGLDEIYEGAVGCCKQKGFLV